MKPSKLPTESIPISRIASPQGVESRACIPIAESLAEVGQVCPVILRRIRGRGATGPTLEIFDGRKRLLAAKKLKWHEIKAIVIDAHSDKLATRWSNLMRDLIDNKLSDFDLARAVSELDEQHEVGGREFARTTGLSVPYVYNLRRWYRRLPTEIRKAWQNGDPFCTQRELEHLSHLDEGEALATWRRHKQLNTPRIHPTPTETSTRRISRREILRLQEAIQTSALKESIKLLCTDILRYTLGIQRHVPGITDYQNLSDDLVSAT